jgi:hypothetical protein
MSFTSLRIKNQLIFSQLNTAETADYLCSKTYFQSYCTIGALSLNLGLSMFSGILEIKNRLD